MKGKVIFMTRERCELAVKRIKKYNTNGYRMDFVGSDELEAMIRTWMEFEIEDFDYNSRMWFLPEEEFEIELEHWKKFMKTFKKMAKRMIYHSEQIEKEEKIK